MTTRDRGIALTVVLLWGLNFIAIRYSLDHFPPFFLASLRFAVMAVPVLLFVKFPRVPVRWFLLYACGFGIAQFLFLFLAMHLGMPTGLASLVLQTSAPFTVVLGVLFLGERMTGRQVCGILLAVIGIAIIGFARATETDLGWGAVGPIALTVLGGLGWAFGNIGNRLTATHREPGSAQPGDALRLVLWMSVIPPLPFLAMSLVFDGPTAGFDALTTIGSHSGLLAIAGLTYTVLLGTVAGSGLWASLMSRHPASRVAPMSLLVPVVGLTAAWLFFGETPGIAELLGAAVVIAGCALGVMGTGRSPRPTADRVAVSGVSGWRRHALVSPDPS
ncbi:EamA family transporter [Gordonia sp. (in: high G+C Gram-positive bacteria)]|jgi:O-acetylserine/cysteine efflux transporter|uniref:EamA family transporter n=1 Tax=Gordonia sp. (in: high G+C Gram-positive bacteria) TaxID=84139 RepID=UPI0026030103|nr:EamA family transporter [Gordonia sp. (in: high G+C Gram-positive bacteria)]HMS74039.1 EamA family transporter [Gordonia sp. (in: high G+C Gram-positive bacteria)]HQV20014.1 EamA family transporter [Gordonia sp. (in: high G+C Gram-positive bacteria)]